MTSGALCGLRVVDLTAMVMGPYCTQIMADMGADVIKVEPPDGDNARYISSGPEQGMGGVFVNLNRGKRSIVLDLKTKNGKAALERLISNADIFIHSLRAKAIAKLGFDYAHVSSINPRIIYTNCYGYGRGGPYHDFAAYDDTIQAETGFPYLQQIVSGKPDYVGTVIADKVSGMTALYGTLAALFHRERYNEGQEVEVAMFEAMASFVLVEHANGAMFDPPTSKALYRRAVSPNRRPYKTRDGFISVLIYNDKQWNAFLKEIAPPWSLEPFVADLEARARNIDLLYENLAQTLKERSTDEWLKVFRQLDIPCALVRSPADLFDDKHLDAVGFFKTVKSEQGPVKFPGLPTWFSRTPGSISCGAPRLGADQKSILQEDAWLDLVDHLTENESAR